MNNIKQIKEYLAALEHMKKFFNKLLEEEKATIFEPDNEREKLIELTELRMLTKSDLWPNALPANLISNSETKNAKAIGILQMIDTTMSGKKFLDFGCGEGHTIEIAKEIFEADAYGYEIKNHEWNNEKITTNWEFILKNKPYDIILLFDVLDHADEPEDILKKCKMILKEEGKVYVRFHPWFSRSGTHIYNQLNKAYLHLIFNDEELASIGVYQEKLRKIKNIEIYKEWIENAGFIISSEKTTKQDIELFFTHNPSILRRIKSNFNNEFPRNILEIQFIDFVLI